MKVLYVIKPFDKYGGAERVIAAELRYLSEEGHDVIVLTPEFREDIATEYGIPGDVRIRESDERGVFGAGPVIRSLIRTESIELVKSHYRNKEAYAGILYSRRDPLFYTHVHGTIMWFGWQWAKTVHEHKSCVKELFESVPGHREFDDRPELSRKEYLETKLGEYIEGRACRAADRVFVNTEQVQREIQCLYDANSTVVRPGVDEKWTRKEDTKAPPEYPDDTPVVLSVSRLDKRKRIDLLVQAIAELDENLRVQLMIGGTGSDLERLKRIVSQEGITDKVQFLGYIEESELRRYYQHADAFACPGWMSYGITPLEAYSAGTPTFISSDAFVHELLRGKPGITVVEPSVRKWAVAVETVITESPTMDAEATTTIPTWREFCDEKFANVVQ